MTDEKTNRRTSPLPRFAASTILPANLRPRLGMKAGRDVEDRVYTL